MNRLLIPRPAVASAVQSKSIHHSVEERPAPLVAAQTPLTGPGYNCCAHPPPSHAGEVIWCFSVCEFLLFYSLSGVWLCQCVCGWSSASVYTYTTWDLWVHEHHPQRMRMHRSKSGKSEQESSYVLIGCLTIR